VYTTVGKSGFITAMYIVIVPVLGIFLKKKTTWRTWVSVVLSVTGLYLLCIKAGDLSLGYGDLLMLACAFLFAIHILVVDHFMTVSIPVRSGGSDGVTSGTGGADSASSHMLPAALEDHVDGVTLSCIQFGVTALIQIVAMFIFEDPRMDAIMDAAPSILYAGVLSSGVAFTLQVITQRHLTPVVASLIMSMESVFSVLSGWVILGERMSVRETVGCVLMFVAIVLAQLPGRRQVEGETPLIVETNDKS
jgi:drug/metabolite transporter (DMT)-like permease